MDSSSAYYSPSVFSRALSIFSISFGDGKLFLYEIYLSSFNWAFFNALSAFS